MKLYFFLLRLATPFAHMAFHIRYVGKENIPKDGSLIVCSNHRSVIDPFLVAVPFRRQLHFMAKSELFTDHGKIAAWFLRKAGAFPVHRDKGDTESIRTAEDILQKGGVLGIFPQGRVVFDLSPFRPKAGFALLSERTGAPILPVSIYMEGALRFRRRITIRFGEVIPQERLGLKEHSREGLKQACACLAEQINRQLEEKDDRS